MRKGQKRHTGLRMLAMAFCILLVLPTAACGLIAPSEAAMGTTPEPLRPGQTSAPTTEPAPGLPSIEDDVWYAPFSPALTASTARVVDSVRAYPQGDTWDDNVWTRAYRDMLGVTFTYAWTGEEYDLSNAILAMAASDSLPDYLTLPYESFYALASRGLLEPLDEVVERYAHASVREALAAYDAAARKVTSVRGSLYGIASAPAREGLMLWYRDDWLAATAQKPPATFEEMVELMYAFANDPMQTGRKTYGLALNGALFSGENGYPVGLEGFFSAYGAYPTQWQEESGELMHGSVSSGAKQALAALQELLSGSVLNADFASKDPWNDMLTAIYNGEVGMAMAPRWFVEWIEGNRGDNARTENTATWTCMPIPGASGSPNAVPTQARTGDVTCVRSGYAYAELAIKMVNLTRGLLEGDIARPEYISAPGPDNVNIPTAFMAMAAGGGVSDGRRGEYAATVIGALNNGGADRLAGDARIIYARCKAWMDEGEPGSYGIFSQFGPGGSQSVLADMRARGLLMPNAYYGPSTSSLSPDWIALMRERDAAYRSIIAGESAERAFEAYIRFFSENGGKEITREVNDWYAAQ